jgi:hypothetical protein
VPISSPSRTIATRAYMSCSPVRSSCGAVAWRIRSAAMPCSSGPPLRVNEAMTLESFWDQMNAYLTCGVVDSVRRLSAAASRSSKATAAVLLPPTTRASVVSWSSWSARRLR